MKKSKFLALVLAVAVMLMGAGYAYWTDSIKINNTVKTGNLEVKLQDGKVDLPEYVEGDAVVVPNDTHTAKVTLDKLYPGATVHVSIPFENVGDIPVKSAGVKFTKPTGALGEYVEVTSLNVTSGNIEPGKTGNIEFYITVKADAPSSVENDQATFNVTADFTQWNK